MLGTFGVGLVGPEPSVDLLRAEDPLGLELWAELGRETLQVEADDFFARCFPWMADGADPSGSTSEHLPASSSAADSLAQFNSQTPQQPLELGASGCSSISACTPEYQMETPQHPGSDFGHSSSGGDPAVTMFDLAAEAAAAAAATMAAASSAAAAAPMVSSVVAGSASSWVSWGPPKAVTARNPPTGSTLVKRNSQSKELTQQPVAGAAASLSRGSSGNNVDSLSRGSSGKAAHQSLLAPSLTLDSGFEAWLNSDVLGRAASPSFSPTGDSQLHGLAQSMPPSMTQLLSDTILLDSSLRLPSASGDHRLTKKSSGSFNTATAGASSAGGRGGRRSGSGVPIARSSTGVIKDTTRRKVAEIARLEQELQRKLSLATDLQKQNDELQRKERLLKLQVSARERRLYCESVQGITPHLKTLIQGFRTNFNKMIGSTLLAQVSEDPKRFTLKEFMVTWQSFVHEVAELMMEDPDGKSALCADACERAINWVMAVCINAPDLLLRVSNVSMQTGEEYIAPIDFWRDVIAKLQLTTQQVEDLQGISNLYSHLLERMQGECVALMTELSRLVDQDLTTGNPLAAPVENCGMDGHHADMEKKEQVFKQLEMNHRQCSILHTMVAFLVLQVLDTRQCGVFIFASFPSFPQPKHIMAVVCGKMTT